MFITIPPTMKSDKDMILGDNEFSLSLFLREINVCGKC